MWLIIVRIFGKQNLPRFYFVKFELTVRRTRFVVQVSHHLSLTFDFFVLNPSVPAYGVCHSYSVHDRVGVWSGGSAQRDGLPRRLGEFSPGEEVDPPRWLLPTGLHSCS